MTMLKQHRLAKGLTLRQLGQRIGVTVGAVSSWETGRYQPSAKIVPKLARALDLKPMDLMAIISNAGERKAVA